MMMKASDAWASTYCTWDVLPRDLLDDIRPGHRIIHSKRGLLIAKLVVESAMKVCLNPTRLRFALIAEKMSHHYTFRIRIGDEIVGSGYHDLLNRLCERRDNGNHGINSLVKKRHEAQQEVARLRRNKKNHYGCINWQPLLP